MTSITAADLAGLCDDYRDAIFALDLERLAVRDFDDREFCLVAACVHGARIAELTHPRTWN